ncbi:ankyrin repeat domain-containing protein 31-like isoform X2 [Narcine bancroftii]|uniref:ankyrin repeat domain-containing protein 31-like isoform X2 n=1 Tax=Narcine bancroftii TaxID=1343680 RepID=UPI003831B9C2
MPDSDGTQESEDETEERRVHRMLFIDKNAFQLNYTMSDFTPETEAQFGGSSSPVIQLIPQTKSFRLHMDNHQQQVESLKLSDAEDTSEVNLLTGAVITPCTSTQQRKILFDDHLSVGNCTPNVPSIFSRQDSPMESFNLSQAETTDIMQDLFTQILPLEEISVQWNFEQNINSESTSYKLPTVAQPLSDESRISSLTTISLSPQIESPNALSNGAASAERKDGLPMELLPALNKMPLMETVHPVKETLPLVNDRTAIDSSIHDCLGLKTTVFIVHDSNTEADEDLTQITDYEPNSQPLTKTEHLEQKNIELNNDKKSETATPMCKSKKRRTFHVSNASLKSSSQQNSTINSTIRWKSSRKMIATKSTCSWCEFQLHLGSGDIKRKTVTPDHEVPSAKLLEHSEEKKVSTSQNLHLPLKNNLENSSQQGTSNKLTDNNDVQNSKTNMAFCTELLCSKVHRVKQLNNLQDCTKIWTRSNVSLGENKKEKGRENIAKVKTECKQKGIRERKKSTMKEHRRSRADEGSSMHCCDKCQDKNTTKHDDERVVTRSISNISATLKCRKIINRKNIYGETQLHTAAHKGNVNLLRTLIQAGADINQPDNGGWTALHEASNKGFSESVLVLLLAGADVNSKGLNGVTPLQDAVRNRHLQVVNLLMQYGADPFEKNDFGNCALDVALDNHMKQLIINHQQKGKAAVKVDGNHQLVRNRDLKNAVNSKKFEVCRNSKKATMSSNNVDTAPSLKRKTESTHQAKIDVPPNKKTQISRATQNIIENQPMHINVVQSLRRPVTHSMVNLEAQFDTRSGHECTQSNCFEIQCKSPIMKVYNIGKVNEVEARPSCSNVNVQNLVVIDSTVEAQTSLRRSARIRNSNPRFAAQAEGNTVTSKRLHVENSQEDPLACEPCGVENKNKMLTALSCHKNIVTRTVNQLTVPNTEVESMDKFCTVNMLHSSRNKSNISDAPDGILVTTEILNVHNTNEQSEELKKYPKVQANEEILSKEATCNLNMDVTKKTQYERDGGNSGHENPINNIMSHYNLPEQDGLTEIYESVEYIPRFESNAMTDPNVMVDSFHKDEIEQYVHRKNKTIAESFDSRCNSPIISRNESGQNLLELLTSEHIYLQQKINYSTVVDSEKLDNMIAEYNPCNNIASTLHNSEGLSLEPIIPEEKSRGMITSNDQSDNSTFTGDMVMGCKFNTETSVLYPEPQINMDQSTAILSELPTSKLSDAKHLAKAINMEPTEEVNKNETGENINGRISNNKFREPAKETIENGLEHVITETSSRNTLDITEEMSKVHSPKANTDVGNENEKRKRTRKQYTTESSVYDIATSKSCLADPKLKALNKKNGKGETRLHHAVMKRDISSVRSLIAAGIDVNVKDNAGWTALHEASSRGLTDVIHELLKANAEVNCQALNGVSPLHDAAVKVLLHYGADPMQQGENGSNAFDKIVDDKIRYLLETHSNGDVTICEEPQPVSGLPRNNCASSGHEGETLSLQNEKGSEIPPNNISQHDLITITLNEMETKQEKLIKCEFKKPENAGQFELELKQMRTVLNEILVKHKAEKEDLVKKFRASPGSFRQGTLQEQVTALASRQRRFLNLLQKQKSLDQKLKQQQLQPSSLVKDSTCITEGRMRTDASSNEVQLLKPIEELSAGCTTDCSGQVSITCPVNESECIQGHNFLSQGETTIFASQEMDRTTAVKKHSIGCGNESVAITNVLNVTSRSGNVNTVTATKTDSSHRESNSLQTCSLEMLHRQMEILNCGQTDIASTACSSSSQNVSLNAAQSINNSENNFESHHNYMLLNAEKSTDASIMPSSCKKQMYLFPLATTQLTETSLPISSIHRNDQLNVVPNIECTSSEIQQQCLQFNTAESSLKSQNIMKMSASQTNNKYTLRANASYGTCNIQANSLSGRQYNSKSANRGTSQRKLLNLIDLIKEGLIQPGEGVLDLKLQGTYYKAELLTTGMIRGEDRTLYRSPVHWIKELLGDKIPISRRFAWSKVMYKGKELLTYRSMITTSSNIPEIQCASEPITLTDKTSSPAEQHRACTDTISQIQKRSSSSFMQLHEILLIRNEEFLPCHIMNQYWEFFIELDEWSF